MNEIQKRLRSVRNFIMHDIWDRPCRHQYEPHQTWSANSDECRERYQKGMVRARTAPEQERLFNSTHQKRDYLRCWDCGSEKLVR